jgi:hypothetical protein
MSLFNEYVLKRVSPAEPEKYKLVAGDSLVYVIGIPAGTMREIPGEGIPSVFFTIH